MTPFHSFLVGALALATAAVGVIFLRLWRNPVLLRAGGEWRRLALGATVHEGSAGHYVVRLTAYILILLAILAKNRVPRPPSRT
jgi:hypothetical protein